uniref:Uncharacterized protein n=1 Tax=Arundo donax TaxID=35708 RepID=A0A0A9DSU9_ARUDO
MYRIQVCTKLECLKRTTPFYVQVSFNGYQNKQIMKTPSSCTTKPDLPGTS